MKWLADPGPTVFVVVALLYTGVDIVALRHRARPLGIGLAVVGCTTIALALYLLIFPTNRNNRALGSALQIAALTVGAIVTASMSAGAATLLASKAGVFTLSRGAVLLVANWIISGLGFALASLGALLSALGNVQW